MAKKAKPKFSLESYLVHMGFLKDPAAPPHLLEEAVANFQFASGLPVDGNANDATLAQMQEPGCGFVNPPQALSFGFSSAAGPRWASIDLTYFVHMAGGPGTVNLTNAVQQGLSGWQALGFHFSEADDASEAQIHIRWHGNAALGLPGDNGFDGPSRVLAHAFLPGGSGQGELHIDLNESWATSSSLNLGHTIAHEFGHTLGLGHVSDPSALMYSFYNGLGRPMQIDTENIVRLYPELRQPHPDLGADFQKVLSGSLDAAGSDDRQRFQISASSSGNYRVRLDMDAGVDFDLFLGLDRTPGLLAGTYDARSVNPLRGQREELSILVPAAGSVIHGLVVAKLGAGNFTVSRRPPA